MKTDKEVQARAKYWLATAKHDYDTMIVLYEAKRYPDSLFFGHIILEKILKAHYVAENKKEAPKTHDLAYLKKNITNIQLSENELNLLDDANDFNMNTRYPDVKFKFYELATKSYAEKYMSKIIKLFDKLCQELPQ